MPNADELSPAMLDALAPGPLPPGKRHLFSARVALAPGVDKRTVEALKTRGLVHEEHAGVHHLTFRGTAVSHALDLAQKPRQVMVREILRRLDERDEARRERDQLREVSRALADRADGILRGLHQPAHPGRPARRGMVALTEYKAAWAAVEAARAALAEGGNE